MSYHELNSIFKFNNRFYKVVKERRCEKCALHNCDCFSLMDFFGTCEGNHRADKTDIVFKDVTKKIKPLTQS